MNFCLSAKEILPKEDNATGIRKHSLFLFGSVVLVRPIVQDVLQEIQIVLHSLTKVAFSDYLCCLKNHQYVQDNTCGALNLSHAGREVQLADGYNVSGNWEV
jgi:hypothetical protein